MWLSATGTSDTPALSLHDALPIYPEGRGRLAGQGQGQGTRHQRPRDRKSTRLNSSHVKISYAVFCLKKKILDFNFKLSIRNNRLNILRLHPDAPDQVGRLRRVGSG